MKALGRGTEQILGVFKTTGIIADYQFDADDMSDFDYAEASFQESLPVAFQVTLKEPATILGFLEGAQANTFFHPEVVANTITALARSLGFRIRFEDYLMDNYYRDSNFEVQAQDILLEFGVYAQ
mmetsp:Transcript_22853/g.50820  ORF Transcript_22853/g.50820 Transcript_22853/m.50820 type:complete len:125 (+) Transcript_22853:24-398(+)